LQNKAKQDSPTPTVIAWDALELGKKLSVFVTKGKTPAIKRFAKSLRKEFAKSKQARFECVC